MAAMRQCRRPSAHHCTGDVEASRAFRFAVFATEEMMTESLVARVLA